MSSIFGFSNRTPMKKLRFFPVLCLTILLLPVRGISQDKVIIKPVTQPNSTYTMVTITDSDMVMDIKGSKEIVDAMKSAGLNFPMSIKGQQTSEMVTVVQDVNADGEKPAVSTISKGGGFSFVNGQKVELPNQFNQVKLFTRIDNMENVKLDSIVGNLSGDLKEQLKEMVTKRMVVFPDRALGVGDTFDNEFPMKIPVKGMNIEMVVKTKFKVKRITTEEITLDIRQKLEMSVKASEQKMKMEVEGGGDGMAIYNRADSLLKTFDTLIKMDMVIEMEGAKMIIKGDAASKLTMTKS